jgi:putative ATP-binding cassette transporter
MLGSHVIGLLKTGSSQTIVICLAGLSNVVLIALINIAAEQTSLMEPVSTKSRILFLIGFAIFFLSIRSSLFVANHFLQQRLGELRLRIMNKIRLSQLRALESLNQSQIYSALAKEGDYLSQNFPMLVSAIQSVISLIFCLLYIAYLSVPAFLVIASITVFALFYFWSSRQSLNLALLDVNQHEQSLFESIGHFLKGHKEIRLNRVKSNALYQQFLEIGDQLEASIVKVGGQWVSLLMFTNAFLYVLLGIVVFVLPFFLQGFSDVIYKIAATAIFSVGPFTTITITLPILSRANAELDEIYNLEKKLDSNNTFKQSNSNTVEPLFKNFEKIALHNVTFSYRNAAGEVTFASGPFNMQINRGDIIFIRGGNGSGKSTLMKLVSGLYLPEEGIIEVDDIVISDINAQSYREIYSCIFTDFHLFDNLDGIDKVSANRFSELVELMELTGKVNLENNRFSTLKLSHGQRKRLAMIASLLVDKDIYIFDEWAADQDAHFRKVFYHQILPELKSRNKTIIAVTHDEQYWHLCDTLYTLDLGVLSVDPGNPTPI